MPATRRRRWFQVALSVVWIALCFSAFSLSSAVVLLVLLLLTLTVWTRATFKPITRSRKIDAGMTGAFGIAWTGMILTIAKPEKPILTAVLAALFFGLAIAARWTEPATIDEPGSESGPIPPRAE